MNYEDTLKSVELVIKCNEVPLIVGKSGIGKTTLVKEVAKNNGWKLVVIDGNLLKEGEIGGLPTVESYEAEVNGQIVNRKNTIYATHTKLREIDEYINSGYSVLLFIDEINRCEHAVQQELMNLVLNREINGYSLDSDVSVVAAMNPSDKYGDEFEYQVVEMDSAQENRFVWLNMDYDCESWVRWAQGANIDEDVIEFISTFPDYLYVENQNDINATPRSYERISKVYKHYKNSEEKISRNIFMNVVRGNVGRVIAEEFMGYVEGNHKSLISFQDIIKGDSFDENICDDIKKENHTRLYLAAHNIMKIIDDIIENNIDEIYIKKCVDRFTNLISYYPPDLMVGIMKEMKINHISLYEKCLEKEQFVEAYYNAFGYGDK